MLGNIFISLASLASSENGDDTRPSKVPCEEDKLHRTQGFTMFTAGQAGAGSWSVLKNNPQIEHPSNIPALPGRPVVVSSRNGVHPK